MERQLATTLVGPMNVTRAVLPVMRKQRSGHVVTISSSAGFAGFEFGTAYAASKFGVEGWMESLRPRGRAVRHPHDDRQPGLLPHRAAHARSRRTTPTPSIDDYAERSAAQREFWRAHERPAGRRPGQARPGAADHRRRGAAAAAASSPAPTRSAGRAEGRRAASSRSTPSATSRRRSRSTRPRPGAKSRRRRRSSRSPRLRRHTSTSSNQRTEARCHEAHFARRT